uniref:Uncharacterized protein n=1 Tax=Pararge aegeria TaxID=116150 RepID=S4PEH0_9NEOP
MALDNQGIRNLIKTRICLSCGWVARPPWANAPYYNVRRIQTNQAIIDLSVNGEKLNCLHIITLLVQVHHFSGNTLTYTVGLCCFLFHCDNTTLLRVWYLYLTHTSKQLLRGTTVPER